MIKEHFLDNLTKQSVLTISTNIPAELVLGPAVDFFQHPITLYHTSVHLPDAITVGEPIPE